MAAGRKGKPEDENQETLPVVGPGDSLLQASGGMESAEELTKETLLPVTGMVRLSPRELEVIDHPAFQRLFEIYQLGQAHLVYRGATHMRGEHAIGCVSAAMLMVEAIQRGAAAEPPEPSDRWQRACALSETEVAFVRLGVLLHDIGHLPAGHTLEDELGLLSEHDGNERIDLVLNRTDWHGRKYPSLRQLIDRLYENEATAAGQEDDGNALSASQLLTRLVSRDHKDAPSTAGTEFRVGVCRDIIGNTICADLIDYLHRDWMHIGKPRYFDPRLLDYMGILTRTQEEREDRLVIRLGSRDRPRPDAITAILDLLESRYQLSEIVLFHRAKLAATGMLERAIAEYRDTYKTEEEQRSALEELVPDLLECSDPEVTKLLEGKLVGRRATRNGKRVDAAVDILRRLRVRKLHREFHAVYAPDLPPGSVAQIAALYSGDGDPEASGEARQKATQRAAHNRLLAVRALEYELDLSPGTIVMYCPPLAMNSKIAEVGVYSGGLVGSLATVDQSHRLTDGYLKAQQERFQRLWRISFAIERSEYERLKEQDLLGLLRNVIAHITLWVEGDLEENPEDVVRPVAETLINHENSPWFNHTLIPAGKNREQENIDHPGGAPSARSLISLKPSSG
jgi:HD superfamily phosphohydrolase